MEGILRLIHVSTPGDKCIVLILLWNRCGGYLEVDTCINTRREVYGINIAVEQIWRYLVFIER